MYKTNKRGKKRREEKCFNEKGEEQKESEVEYKWNFFFFCSVKKKNETSFFLQDNLFFHSKKKTNTF